VQCTLNHVHYVLSLSLTRSFTFLHLDEDTSLHFTRLFLAVTTNSKMKHSFETWLELLVTMAPEHIE
jgi:hypothetical protein